MNNRSVAVVGLGPTGAFVARAAIDCGYKVTVYVFGQSHLTPPGAFWLHWLPEDMTETFEPVEIKIIGKGKASNYVDLQWGKEIGKHYHTSSSFTEGMVIEEGYNPAQVLPKLVPDSVLIEYVAFPLSDIDVVGLTHSHQYVFQTFPRKVDVLTQPERIPYIAAARFDCKDPNQNVVVYNGTGNGIVVREAYLFGHHFLEFPKNMPLVEVLGNYDLSDYQHVVLKDLHPATTPIQADPLGRVYLMGRFAQWDRKCLSHDAYSRTVQILTGDGHNG